MSDVIRVSAVSFLNTIPYLAGFEYLRNPHRYEVSVDTPAICAHKLADGNADLGLVPIVAVKELLDFHQVTRWGIGCDGPVGSVLIVSQEPVDQIDTVFLSEQSRTSNRLARVILADFFDVHPTFREGDIQSSLLLEEGQAAVMIGDRALQNRQHFRYVYDLGDCWKQLTGLPFVFAYWVGSDRVTDEDASQLEQAFARGMHNRPMLAAKFQASFPMVNVHDYLMNHIIYDLSEDRFAQGQEAFLERLLVSHHVQNIDLS